METELLMIAVLAAAAAAVLSAVAAVGVMQMRRTQAQALDLAQQAADYFGWTRVSCVRDGKLRSIEDIHEELYARIKSCLEEV